MIDNRFTKNTAFHVKVAINCFSRRLRRLTQMELSC
jgi:hypothetical protein